MRNLWHRLLVKLGLRKAPQPKYSRAEVSILGPDGKRIVIGVFKAVTYGPLPDYHVLGAPEKKTYIAGKTEVESNMWKGFKKADLFRERHCSACLANCACGKGRNEAHREGCSHVCTHTYQSFLKFAPKEFHYKGNGVGEES